MPYFCIYFVLQAYILVGALQYLELLLLTDPLKTVFCYFCAHQYQPTNLHFPMFYLFIIQPVLLPTDKAIIFPSIFRHHPTLETNSFFGP